VEEPGEAASQSTILIRERIGDRVQAHDTVDTHKKEAFEPGVGAESSTASQINQGAGQKTE